jgi:hypothetical protein
MVGCILSPRKSRMSQAHAVKSSRRPARRATLKQVLEDVRRLRSSSEAVYGRLIRELSKQLAA